MSLRKMGFALLPMAGIACAGCALVDAGRGLTDSTIKMFKPRPTDYRDLTEEEGDEWASVGQEARGDRPLVDENDALKPLIMSKKAQAIERNLGLK